MQTKKTIAIIGATGKMGAAIAKSLAKGNFSLLLVDHCPEKTQLLLQEIKAAFPTAQVEGINCAVNAGWEADIIISAVPYCKEKELAGLIREVANQKIVISITNYINETGDELLTATGTSAAEELQQLLPNSKIVKAFNTSSVEDFTSTLIAGKQLDAFIAGNNEEALQTVSDIIKIAGFNPIIAGNLSESRTLENMQLLLLRHA